MKQKSLRTSPIFYLVIATTIAFAGLWYFVNQKLIAVTALQQQINVLQADETKFNENSSAYQDFQSLLTSWEKSLPKNEEEVATFARSTEALARSLALVLTLDFDDFPTQVDIGGRYANGIGLEMSLEGGYQNLTSFIHQLNSLPYFFKIDKLIITQNELKLGTKTSLNGVLIMQ